MRTYHVSSGLLKDGIIAVCKSIRNCFQPFAELLLQYDVSHKHAGASDELVVQVLMVGGVVLVVVEGGRRGGGRGFFHRRHPSTVTMPMAKRHTIRPCILK